MISNRENKKEISIKLDPNTSFSHLWSIIQILRNMLNPELTKGHRLEAYIANSLQQKTILGKKRYFYLQKQKEEIKKSLQIIKTLPDEVFTQKKMCPFQTRILIEQILPYIK